MLEKKIKLSDLRNYLSYAVGRRDYYDSEINRLSLKKDCEVRYRIRKIEYCREQKSFWDGRVSAMKDMLAY